MRILFTDLDDTLFQSFRKETPDERSIPLAYLADGSAISYANPQQQAALALFQREMTVIPVTARNHDAFKRVRIPFVAVSYTHLDVYKRQGHGEGIPP